MKNISLTHEPQRRVVRFACPIPGLQRPRGRRDALPYRAIALSLLLGALSASALQTSTPGTQPGSTTAEPANARPAHPNLTRAAPVASQVPASSKEDIRDIRQPRHLPTPLAWAAVAAGVIILTAMAFAAWRWLRRGKLLALTPCAAALQQLEEARRLMDPEHAREYCFAASQIIRNYIEAQFHVHAPRLTTEEFLRDLVEVRETMLASHRALLGDFLEHCDLAKFAGWRYSMAALEDMHNTAITFVRQAAPDREPSPARSAGHGQLLRAGDGSRSGADIASPHADDSSLRVGEPEPANTPLPG